MPKQVLIDVKAVTVTKPNMYIATIQGMDGILFNCIPNLGQPKIENKNQSKQDPLEREKANWRNKSYFDEDEMLYIPGENIHECLKEAAKYWGQRIPGEGQKTYTDVIAKAVICENLNFGIKKDSDKLIPFMKMCNATPSKGKKSGAKVPKIRPLLRPWSGSFTIHVFDARLTVDILRVILTYAGTFIGMCDWRPVFGRFTLTDIQEK